MSEEIMRYIIKRQSHIIVYDPHHGKLKDKDFNKSISVLESNGMGGFWVSYKSFMFGHDPKGRQILKLPRNYPDAMLAKVWPDHQILQNEAGKGAWGHRTIDVQFKLDQFPPKTVDQNKIVQYLVNNETRHSTKLVKADTGTGKSYSTIRAWCEKKTPLLGTFAQTNHLENFKNDMLKFTNITEDEILVIDDGMSTVERALKKDDDAIHKYKAILVLHRTVSNSIAESLTEDRVIKKLDRISELILRVGVGFHTSDECHLEYRSVMDLAMMTNIKDTAYLSATPERSKWQEDRVFKLQIPRETMLVIAGAPRLQIKQISFDSQPAANEVIKSVNRQGYFDVSRYYKYISQADKFHPFFEKLTRIMQYAFEDGADSLGIITDANLDFISFLLSNVERAYPEKTVGNYTSLIKKKDIREEELHKDIVLSTDSSFNGSINPVRMTHMIFMSMSVISKVRVEQVTGRLRGIDGRPCVVLDFYDIGYPKLRDNGAARRSVLKKISKSVEAKTFEAFMDSNNA